MPSAANVLLEAWSVCDTPQRKRTAGMLTDRWPGKKLLPKERHGLKKKNSLLSAVPSLSFFLVGLVFYKVELCFRGSCIVIAEHMCYICSKRVEGLKNNNESTEIC